MIAADIFKKLRLNSTQKILIVNAPREYLDSLGALSYDTALYSPAKRLLRSYHGQNPVWVGHQPSAMQLHWHRPFP